MKVILPNPPEGYEAEAEYRRPQQGDYVYLRGWTGRDEAVRIGEDEITPPFSVLCLTPKKPRETLQ